jgi:hypothetical protein
MRAKIIIRNNSEYDHEELEFDNKRGKAFIGKEDLKIGDKVVIIGAPNSLGQIEAKLLRIIKAPLDSVINRIK